MAITKELWGSRTLSKSFDGWTGTRELISDDWVNRVSDAPALGSAHPDYPQMYAQAEDFEPYGEGTDANGYSQCKITVYYTTRQRTTGSENIEFSGITKESTWAMKWGDGSGDPINERVYITDPAAVFTFEVFRTVIPWTTIMNLIGKVNEFEYRGHPVQHLRFIGASATKELNITGGTRYSLIYKFIRKPNSWNKLVKTKLDDYVVIQNEDGTPFYPVADFSTLPT